MMFHYGVDGISGFSYNGTNYTYKKNILGDIIGIYKEDVEIVRYSYDTWGKHRTFILNDENFVDIEEEIDYTILTSDEQLVINDRKFIAEINPFRYRGYYYDTETKLYYLNSRYYDPETGRFLNADDISILNTAKDEINGLNLYAYCFNNPINDTDANGNWSWKKFWKGVGLTIAAAVVVVAVAAVTAATAGMAAAILVPTTQIALSVINVAFVGGIVAGGLSILGQGLTNGFDNLNLLSVMIDTFQGSVYGGITAGVGIAGTATAKILGAIGYVGLSGFTSLLHGLNNGLKSSDLFKNVGLSMLTSFLTQAFVIRLSFIQKSGNVKNATGIKKVFRDIVNKFIKDSLFKTVFMQGFFSARDSLSGKYK